jgi:hypothetical protein
MRLVVTEFEKNAERSSCGLISGTAPEIACHDIGTSKKLRTILSLVEI